MHIGNVSLHLRITGNLLENASRGRIVIHAIAIEVVNTRNLTIDNNTIDNCTSGPEPFYKETIGISSASSSVVIRDNDLKAVDWGIYSQNDDTTIQGNTISANDRGMNIRLPKRAHIEDNRIDALNRSIRATEDAIYIEGSKNIRVVNNTVTGFEIGIHYMGDSGEFDRNDISQCEVGIKVAGSSGLKVSNNTISGDLVGIAFSSSGYGTYTNNTLLDCGIVVESGFEFLRSNSVDMTNKINGNPILFLERTSDRDIGSGWGQIILTECDDIRIKNSVMPGYFAGITTTYSSNIIIENLTVLNKAPGRFAHFSIGEDYRIANCTLENVTVEVIRSDWPLPDVRETIICDNTLVNGSITNEALTKANILNNVVLTHHDEGIWAMDVSSSVISGNNVTMLEPTDETVGIYISGEVPMMVTDNELHGSGFFFGGYYFDLRDVLWSNNTFGGKPVIYRSGDQLFNVTGDPGQILLIECNAVRIENLEFEGCNVPIFLGGCYGVYITDCTFTGSLNVSIHTIHGQKIYVTGCTFNDTYRAFYGFMPEELEIIGNNLDNCTFAGIDLYGGEDHIIERNIIRASGGYGIWIESPRADVWIRENYIMDCRQEAVRVYNGGNIYHNTFVDNNVGPWPGGIVRPQGKTWGYSTWSMNEGGNYWSDYELRYPLATNDGEFWSRPYETDYRNQDRNKDMKPLVYPRFDPFPPTAVVGKDLRVLEGETFTLNGSRSYDDTVIASHTWTVWEKDGPVILEGEVVKHRINKMGTYNVTLEVTDYGNNSNFANMVVEVLFNIPPVVVSLENMTVNLGTVVTLDGSGSYDDNGPVIYRWSLTYGGNEVVRNGEVLNFLFELEGVYNVTLTVIDIYGKSSSTLAVIEVRDIEPPVPTVVVVAEALIGQSVAFVAMNSTDNVGIESYDWSFTYDGTLQVLSGIITHFIFEIPGTYDVTLIVADAAGNSNKTTVTLVVYDMEAPLFGPYGGMVETIVPTLDIMIRYNWTLWSDDDARFPDGANFTYSMSKDGETYVGYGEFAEITLPGPGMYLVTFTAIDASGNEATDGHQLIVNWYPQDVSPPVPHAGEDVEVTVGETVDLNGTYTPGDLELEVWGWTTPDLAGELIEEFNFPLGGFTIGEFIYIFQVMDWMGNGGNDSLTIRVLPRTPDVKIAPNLRRPLAMDLNMSGSVMADVDVQLVEFRINGGEWDTAEGTSSWNFMLPVMSLSDGNHTIEVRAWDGFNHGTTGPVPFTVEKPDQPPTNGGEDDGNMWMFLAILMVIGVVIAVVFVYLFKGRKDNRVR